MELSLAPLDHAKLNLCLLNVLALYAQQAGLGTVLGTRSPGRISQFGGRLPDLFFVRREREHLVTSKATLGAPDLVLELVSPNDRRADVNATEADYRTVGVGEIVYIDQPRRRVRVLRRTDAGYGEQTLSSGQPLTLHSLGGLTLPWDWLFVEPRPDEMDTVLALLAERPA